MSAPASSATERGDTQAPASAGVHFHASLLPAFLNAALLIMFLAAPPLAAESGVALHWTQLPLFPDKRGVAGAFAGVSGSALVVAGGANFPDKMPWEGGAKVWHDPVFVLDQPNGPWRHAGKLPRPLAYGVSASHADGVICTGGSDATRHYRETFRLRWKNDAIQTEALPLLPRSCANLCGAVVGNTFHVAGGIETPLATNTMSAFWALDLSDTKAQWRELEPWPGPSRMLAIAAAQGGDFFLFGGVDLRGGRDGKPERIWLRDAWRYRPGTGWTRLADLPKPCGAAPSPAPVVKGRVLLLAGDDGSRAGFQPLDKHPGFPKTVLAYDFTRDCWSEVGEVPAPRATLPCVEWRGMFVVPSGEARPGVRSPEVWSMRAP
jgi:N-acetylneuraminic acid mutarotase